MRTLKINTLQELKNYKTSKEVFNLDFQTWNDGDINLRHATTGDINLTGATTGDIDLTGATTGDIDLTGATTGYIDLDRATTGDIYLIGATTGDINLTEATTGDILQNYTPDDFELLRSIPLDRLNMSSWHTDEKWLCCKTIKEIHECGTAHCVRGYGEVNFFLKHGKQCENPNTLHPNLKYLFHMTDEQAKIEIQKILSK